MAHAEATAASSLRSARIRRTRTRASSRRDSPAVRCNRSKVQGDNPADSRDNRSKGANPALQASKADKANKDCLANRSNSANRGPVAGRRSSKTASAGSKGPPDNPGRASQAYLVSRSNSASRVPVAHRSSSKAKAGSKADPDNPDRVNKVSRAHLVNL